MKKLYPFIKIRFQVPLMTQHERDVDTGWDFRNARFRFYYLVEVSNY